MNYKKKEILTFGVLISLFRMGFSLLRALEFFVDPKNGNARNQNPPALRVESNRNTKNHLSVTIELFRHYCKKGKVILWQIRITI